MVPLQNPTTDGPLEEHIHTRGWTMQEHLLANRIPVYGRFGLRWARRTERWFDGLWTEDQMTGDVVGEITDGGPWLEMRDRGAR
jgi:hypothetical protein